MVQQYFRSQRDIQGTWAALIVDQFLCFFQIGHGVKVCFPLLEKKKRKEKVMLWIAANQRVIFTMFSLALCVQHTILEFSMLSSFRSFSIVEKKSTG